MKRRKTLLIVFSIVLLLLIFSIVYAGFNISLEKHVSGLQPALATTTNNFTFNIYDSATAITPIASQTFAIDEIMLEPYNNQFVFITTTPMMTTSTKLKVDFTNTDAITRDMDLWVEIEFDGVVKGDREQVKHEAWSMFSYDGVPSGVIVAWSGSIDSIPSGWALCDSTNGTPDLRSAFIIGASNQSMVGSSGFFRHTHKAGGYYVPISYTATATPLNPAPVSGTSASIQSLPVPYYSLAYIMKL